ncbi:hypothetical protein AQ1_01264 [alpha proteobacterium Q-1]|nr:hypothetical protein AQ1_01264 [alpha proteobacterium Q-1]
MLSSLKAHLAPMAVVALMAGGFGSSVAMADDHKEKPKAYIVNLEDGAVVESPVKVVFGLKNYGVAPAGVDKEGTGHHHLLINASLSDEDMTYPIPADDQHRHFGGGQTQTTLDLEPGDYRLQLVLGDANHVPIDPPIVSKPITITVK